MSMKDFIENHCRCCRKVFCCKKCREKHENKEHGIFPECDICLYGKAVLTHASENLLQHVKCMHLPLRCVFCKRFFGTTDELKNHSKCPVGFKIVDDLQKSPYTPGQSYNESVYDSSPLSLLFLKESLPNKNLNMFSNLATSTPMQGTDENNLSEQIHEAITPVDYSGTDKQIETQKKQNSDSSLKRRVTFCETPMAESYRKQNVLKKKQIQETGRLPSGPFSGNGSSGIFYSVKEELQEDTEVNEDEIKPKSDDKEVPEVVVEEFKETEDKENYVKHEDSTLWVSAVNVSSDFTEEKSDITSNNMQTVATPIATKLKKRQINVVIPTLARNSEGSLRNIAETKPENSGVNIAIEYEELQSNSPTKVLTSPVDATHKTDVENLDSSSNSHEIITETSLNTVHSRLWRSMNKFIRNITSVIQGVSSVDEKIPNSLKRRSSDFDVSDAPCVKRYKLTEIKCRPAIRDLPLSYIDVSSWKVHDDSSNSYNPYRKKIYVDKATQTDDYFP